MSKQNLSADLAIAALQWMHEAVVILDEQAIIQFMNGSAGQLLGVDADEIVGTRFEHVPEEGLTGTFRTRAWSAHVEGRQLHFRATSVFDHSPRTGALSVEGKRIGSLVAIQDKPPEMEVADHLYVIACELRTPATAIQGYAESLLHNIGNSLGGAQRKMVKEIRRCAERLLGTCDYVLDMWHELRPR